MRINIYLDISLLAHFKHKGKYMVTVRMPKYMYDQNICLNYALPLLFICVRFYEY